MIINIIRFLCGSVNCTAKGRFTERLINILNKNGFTYWDIMPGSEGFSFNLKAGEYKRLRDNLKGTGIVTRINRKKGLPFICKKYKSRKGLIIGLILFVLIMIVLSKFIWITTVNGNNKIPEIKIMSVLKNNGLYNGAYANGIDNKSLERKVMEELPDIRWISVNITGCKAEVEIKEKYDSPKILNENDYCNIVAKKDAVVLKTNVINGTGEVKKGSAVAKGQLLISGVITGAQGDSHFVKARGKIMGRTKYHKVYKLPKKRKIPVLTGKVKERTRGNFLWFSVPLGYSYNYFQSYKVGGYNESLNINNISLPASVTRERIMEIKGKNISLKENKKELQTLMRFKEIFEFKDKSIENRKCRYSQDKKYYYLEVDYTVRENICRRIPFTVE